VIKRIMPHIKTINNNNHPSTTALSARSIAIKPPITENKQI
jgi:hypothetical protein